MNKQSRTQLKSIIVASALALAAMPSFTGCATITRGTKEALVIETDPPGTEVELSNGLRGTTPTSFKTARKRDLVVTIKKEGYETVTLQIAGAGAAGMAGNIILVA